MQAKLFSGIMYAQDTVLQQALEKLQEKFGPIVTKSEIFDFTFTNYYKKEFGSNLKKLFVVFKKPIERESLPDIKLFTIALEKQFSEQGKRRINIDPGYIALNNVVVATTKELPHRVYLSKGIFADLQLILKKGKAETLKHTFADYMANKEFFIRIRDQV
ncbi:MAG: DUF4416 family protein [Candidatus Woesearchaeota archaeon]